MPHVKDDIIKGNTVGINRDALLSFVNHYQETTFFDVINFENKDIETNYIKHNNEPLEAPTIQNSALGKRLSDLKDFICFLKKAADMKGIEIDVHYLPCTKEMLLDKLKERHPNKTHWRVEKDSFEKLWQTQERKNICDNIKSSTQVDKDFFKKILN